ncbi:NUDIX domain-containing protein [Brevibacterium sanguinis]|uniref:NUDIX domain-containing protein n=2 Tax=Brevibacterium TaxID=1696 RepID=A0A366IP41_9MICO|nr:MULTISPECIES: NUDIX hydrolase [Brevibacterium]RBP67015.1 NUDIX domain-containing protein [Brevibacterium sanguinis]RBP73540.1 NUDIX domain-containing protein [Brevibacterium celere]
MIRDISPEGSDRSDTADSASARIDVPDPAAVPIRPAVSVLMVRDGRHGLEVFVQHRVTTMDFAAGVVVFPGGRVDPSDVSRAETLDVADPRVHDEAWTNSSIAEVPDGWRVLLAAAVREVEEETGTLLDPSLLRPWANWVTPLGLPRRFDTYFYLALVGEIHAPAHRTTEAHTSEWLPVEEILAEESAGRLRLMRPTLVLLGELSGFRDTAELSALDRRFDPVRPDLPAS